MELLKLKEYQERSYAEMPSAKGYINYGDDNLFPQYLIDLYHSSATHNALTTSIAYMIYADGVQADTTDAQLKMAEWGLDDELRKACLDLKIQGGFALELVWSIDRTTIAEVRHCPFENIRSGEVDENEEVQFYYYSKDWNDKRIEPEMVRAFSPDEANEYPLQILYVKPFSPGSYYYPKPDYIGSINYIELDKEIGTYHINNIKNGLAPSFTIHFKNGVPAQEERNKIRNDIERQLAGATNAGKFIVTYSDSPERKPDFEPFPLSDADKQYQFLSTEVSDKIMVGHRVVSSAMFGVKTAGQLGNTQELEIASKLFDKQVVKPYQRIVKDALESIFTAAGTPTVVSVEEVPPMEPVEVEMSRKGCCNLSEEITLNIDAAEWLIEQGEEINEDEWVLIDEREYDQELEQVQDAQWNFAMRVPGGTSDTNTAPDNRSQIDNDVVKIRYIYDGSQNPEREFCQKMMSSQRVYRREDIVGANWPASLGGASARAVNPGFGPNGTDTYDLLLYKGGPNCKHRWIRRTYLKRNNQRVSVNRARQIISQLPEPQRRANQIPTQDPRISQIPATMPNNGYLNPR
jgi:hypothetical protein